MMEQDPVPYFRPVIAPDSLLRPPFGADDRQPQVAERVLWQGHTAVAEYVLSETELATAMWNMPASTEVTITDRRVAYTHVAHGPGPWPPPRGTAPPTGPTDEVSMGEVRWLWPHHLRVQPAARSAEAVAEIHLVCAAENGTWPTLVLAGGDLTRVNDADRIGNLLRRAIVQFRLDNPGGLKLSTAQLRMLSKLVILPEFSNFSGGRGQTVSLPGAFPLLRSGQAAPDASRLDTLDLTGQAETVDLTTQSALLVSRVADMVRAAGARLDENVPMTGPTSDPTRRHRFAANSGPMRIIGRRPGLGPDPRGSGDHHR